MNRQVWIGLVHVMPKEGNTLLEECIGAYANVVATAANENEFRSRIDAAMKDLAFDVDSLEDVEPLQSRLTKYHVDPELVDLAEKAAESEKVMFDAFEAYRSDEDDGQ